MHVLLGHGLMRLNVSPCSEDVHSLVSGFESIHNRISSAATWMSGNSDSLLLSNILSPLKSQSKYGCLF